MTPSLFMRVRPVLGAALAVSLILLSACSGGSGSGAPYQIISPSSNNVTVLPGQTVRFEIRANGGRTVEYLIDETQTEPGPVFVFLPTGQHHVIRALIRSTQPAATPDVVVFNVDVEAPGNLPPQIGSFTVEPATGEAGTTVFTARVTATDADGSIADLSVDWGDGSTPATGTTSPFTANHTYTAAGSYTLTARAVDNVGVPVTSTRQLDVSPHNDLPTGSLHSQLASGAPPQGTGPLMVHLFTQGTDPDGTIATWELDKDLGEGFQLIAPNESVTVTYPFREEHYMPVLRLTDDRGAVVEIQADQDIVVLRDVSAVNSSYTVAGNSRFDPTDIAPAVWADGQDPLQFTIQVRDSEGMPVPGTRVRVASTRPELVAPNGSALGSAVSVMPSPVLTADFNGTVTGSIVTGTSTRVEAIPDINFVPFGLELEVDLGRDIWVPFDLDQEPLNANTTVSSAGGQVNVFPMLVCPGEQVEIEVRALDHSAAPGGGGPAMGKYTILLYSNRQPLSGYGPAPGYSTWRTDGGGVIRFHYTPVREDQSKLFLAWVDGQPLDALGTLFLRPPGECGGN